jgi:diacylglycerol kinase family enzyme
MLPELLTGRSGPRLVVRIDDEVTIEAPQALLVSNNPYESADLAGLDRRARLDTGALGVVGITVDNTAQAMDLVRGRRARGVRRFLAHEVVIDADTDRIPVGIDGEAVMMPTPVRCTIRPLALRVRVPRDRPGVPAAIPQIDRTLLLRQALGMSS